MKLKASIILALAGSITAASAATTLITTDPTTYTDGGTSEGNWHYQSLTLNDAGFTATGDALGASVTIQSITFAHDTASTADGLYLVAMTDVTDLSTIAAQSTNSVDQTGLAGGALMTWNFSGDTLSTSTEYFFAWYQDTGGANGTIDAGDTAATARIAMNASTIAGGLRNAPTGGIASAQDGMMNIQVNNVPEPSSTALLGLGGLALILRRRK